MKDKFIETNNIKLIPLRYGLRKTDFKAKIDKIYDECYNKINDIIRKTRSGIIYVLTDNAVIQADETDKEYEFSRITIGLCNDIFGIQVFNSNMNKWITITNKASYLKLYDLICEYGKEYETKLF